MQELVDRINEILKTKDRVTVAIDGRCGAGKTTLAEEIRKELDCVVIHMDDFFLSPEQRTKERLEIPGENVDHERFLKEVLVPLAAGESFSYRPYRCKEMSFGDPIFVRDTKVVVVEGSYSCHEKLWEYYDLRVFVDVSCDEQIKRIEKRNGEEAKKTFEEVWIPLEEKYFKAFNIKEKCEIYVGENRN